MVSEHPIKIAVIGAGKMANKIHLPVLRELGNEGRIQLVMLCDVDEQGRKAAAQEYGFLENTSDAANIFTRDDVDAVYVFGTVLMHVEYALAALRSGKHVFVEKPPAPDEKTMKEIYDTARQQKKVFAAGFNRRFQSNIQYVKKELTRLSSPLSLEGVFHKPAYGVPVPYGNSSWVMSNGIHAVDTLLHLAGSLPSHVSSSGNGGENNIFENVSAVLKWENGMHATLACNNLAGARMERYVAHVPSVSYVCEDRGVAVIRGGEKEKISFSESNKDRGFYGEHKEFLDAISEGREPIHDAFAAFAAVRLTKLIERGYTGEVLWDREHEDIKSSDTLSSERNSHSSSTLRSVPQDGAVLVLNASAIRSTLPELQKKYKVVFPDTTDSVDPKQVVAAITGKGGKPVTDELLEKFHNLRVVGVVGASLKKYNPEGILKKKIPIINVSEIYAETVAEFTLLMAIAGVRNAVRSHDVMRGGGWGVKLPSWRQKVFTNLQKIGTFPVLSSIKPAVKKVAQKTLVENEPAGPKKPGDFRGTSVGIIGWGEISKKFAEYLAPFGCKVIVVSEYLQKEEAEKYGVLKGSMVEALQCKVVSLHRGLSERTKKSFGRSEIEALSSGAVFINTARAELVDNKALLSRLQKGDIYACLDVYNEEPLPKNDPLRSLPNVFLTSHLSGSTKDMYERASETLVKKVVRYLEGDEVSSVVLSDEKFQNMT